MTNVYIEVAEQMNTVEVSEEPASHVVHFDEVLRIPEFHQTSGSLSPLEKCQLGVLISATQPKVIVETGVWRGATTRFLSEFLRVNRIAGRVYGFDLPEIINELVSSDTFFRSASNVTLIRGMLPQSLSDWMETEKKNVDLALIDANHSFYAVYSELSVIAPRLSPNGYIFCHDYGNPGTTFGRVMCAVNEFAKRHDFVVLPFHSQSDSMANLKCEAAVLRRPVRCPLNKRLYGWRKYYAEAYPRVGRIWGSLRDKTGL
jgi:predicted O-methyltransferase YrrM